MYLWKICADSSCGIELSILALILFTVGTSGLEHLVVFSFLYAFVDQLLPNASSVVVFAIDGSDRDNVSS
jgi:hypothetical protein